MLPIKTKNLTAKLAKNALTATFMPKHEQSLPFILPTQYQYCRLFGRGGLRGAENKKERGVQITRSFRGVLVSKYRVLLSLDQEPPDNDRSAFC